ncbi:MAG: thioredoxin family protein [Betaproteobacteria bacterium]|nr:thioredoxin family protein [Betaproteobacteria bacterium]MDH5342703.1 thioredoxin family protein [Betaproteobacteria bacterium]
MPATLLKDGLVAFSKRGCPTCVMIEGEMQRAAREKNDFQIVSQDDPRFPPDVDAVIDDRDLNLSWTNNIEFMPTLIRFEGGREMERVVGWDREGWQRLTGIKDLGQQHPKLKPG